MRLNNILVCLLLTAGVFGGRLAFHGDRSSRVTLYLQEPGVDVRVGDTTIHNASRVEILDLAPGTYEVHVSRGPRELYFERIKLEPEDEWIVRASWL